ncbi:hypothetical protein LJR225_000028 [Phenylobacterium sp. LjRoot225]|uniref:hypothetical protein n=1 Tax=Phenylobacterium sp. LjRoot225 TaxID=3342285 RepID=UPI003ECECE56
MRDYHLSLLDVAGRERAAFAFPAENDRDAVRLSQQAAEGGPASLWSGATLLLRLDAFTEMDRGAAAWSTSLAV